MEIQIEIWKNIPEYEGLYQASNLGQIKRVSGVHCIRSRIIKQHKNSRGYFKVVLSKNDKIKNCLVHRIIAECFIPRIEEYNIVNHINIQPEDNRADNLEWCTQKINMHSSKTNRGKK